MVCTAPSWFSNALKINALHFIHVRQKHTARGYLSGNGQLWMEKVTGLKRRRKKKEVVERRGISETP